MLVYGVEPPGGVGEEFQAHQRALAELGNIGRPRDPLQIPVDEVRLGRSPDPTARDDMEQDQACPSVSIPVLVPGCAPGSLAAGGGGASPNAHIRSRL